jgi:hypothetical protein
LLGSPLFSHLSFCATRTHGSLWSIFIPRSDLRQTRLHSSPRNAENFPAIERQQPTQSLVVAILFATVRCFAGCSSVPTQNAPDSGLAQLEELQVGNRSQEASEQDKSDIELTSFLWPGKSHDDILADALFEKDINSAVRRFTTPQVRQGGNQTQLAMRVES